ncbi:XRE family transcriptional regulator [Nocardia sp. CC227C]|uniref:helix-turn-helix domain-containing protein n=1 Tax=Nocardia sp. CC227C TaxID=3044562 RepID=UPI00278C6FC1|nr:XRE family transcriptional regulator [Nocardia sp. CC227C]
MSDTAHRVRALIQASGLSQRDFANRVGLDDSKLSKSLTGVRRFSSDDLTRIAQLCEVTVDWLVTGIEQPVTMAARTTGGSAEHAIRTAQRYIGIRGEIAALGYPQPWQPISVDTTGTYREQGTRLAAAATARLSAAGRSIVEPNLAGLVETCFGADVTAIDLGTGFDGLATSAAHAKLIVLATGTVPARQRFTLAHELGHLLAGDDQDMHIDTDIYARTRSPSEMRANAFASAFLMPEDLLRETCTTSLTPEGFANLSYELQVTPSALAFRLLGLRLIDAGTCDRYKTITAAKAAGMIGRSSEFAHRVTEARRLRPPGLLVRDSYAAYESGAATLRPYADLLEADVDELRQALELERDA